jgi:glycosyltransferase involved in cell wall biosynthesis
MRPSPQLQKIVCTSDLGMKRIVNLQRKPVVGHYSIEVLFAGLREEMRELGYKVVCAVVPYRSTGCWRRFADICWAWWCQGDVNHITGDVHFLALGLSRERTILTIHDCFPLEHLTGIGRWLVRILWFDWPIRCAAIVTVISEETKRQLLRHVRVPEEKIVVIPDAVSPIFRPCPRAFREDCPQILQVGTPVNKNLPRLVEALKGMKCRLKIIGVVDAKIRAQLEAADISYEAAANVDEETLYRAYCDADLVSFASTYEGFGMPIIEAQWVERPVVTSNCSSMPEVAGEGACLVDPFDVNSIRAGLQRVISDPSYRAQLIEQGRKNRERFSLEKVARQYLSLYERVALEAKS